MVEGGALFAFAGDKAHQSKVTCCLLSWMSLCCEMMIDHVEGLFTPFIRAEWWHVYVTDKRRASLYVNVDYITPFALFLVSLTASSDSLLYEYMAGLQAAHRHICHLASRGAISGPTISDHILRF